jgi:hypothetical protein
MGHHFDFDFGFWNPISILNLILKTEKPAPFLKPALLLRLRRRLERAAPTAGRILTAPAAVAYTTPSSGSDYTVGLTVAAAPLEGLIRLVSGTSSAVRTDNMPA